MRPFAYILWAAVAMSASASAMGQTPYVTYYQPSTVYYPAPAPAAYTAPTVTYYSAPTRYYSYYPSTTYSYAPSTYGYSASPVVTRYRPILGRTVQRYVTGYAPTYFYGY